MANQHLEWCTPVWKRPAVRPGRHFSSVTGSTQIWNAVKGLEYDKVYIMNVNEGSIPYKKAVLAESLEEERRLFYVGMTRAKKELMLCYVRRQYDKERDPSRFLEETGLF